MGRSSGFLPVTFALPFHGERHPSLLRIGVDPQFCWSSATKRLLAEAVRSSHPPP